MLDKKIPLVWGRAPVFKCKNYDELFEALGEFSNPKYCSIHYEYNTQNGSFSDVYRVQFSISTDYLITPVKNKITSHSRFNCNDFFVFLVNNKVFSHDIATNKITRDYQTILNWVQSIDPKYVEAFNKGYFETLNTLLPQEPKIKLEDLVIINDEYVNQLQPRTFIKKEIPSSKQTQTSTPKPKKRVRKVDYVRKNIRDTELGLIGEFYVYQSEYNKLKEAVKKGQIESVEEFLSWVSKIDDSAGYDIKSFDLENQKEIYIEVKTTASSANTPFYISENELDFSETHSNNYKLYRLYNLSKDSLENIEYFEIDGNLKEHSSLVITPKTYEVRIK